MADQDDGTPIGGDRSLRWAMVAVVFVVLAPIAGVAARSASGPRFVLLIGLEVVAAALAFLIPQWRQVSANKAEATAEEREIEARVDTRVAVNDALDPILRLLANQSVETDPLTREQLRAQAVPLVLMTAATLVGAERARACWFRMQAGPPLQLVPVEHAGRAGAPTRVFTAGTRSGDAALDLVLGDRDLFCRDVLDEPPPGWDQAAQPDYRSFIAVSVIAADTALGMLTVDALDADALTTDDQGILRLLAGALAVALAMP